MRGTTDVLIKTADKKEADNLVTMIKSMDDREKDGMLIFLQGVKFAQTIGNGAKKM